ncbi:hypothetical protein [Dokdonella sp.]|uniref:hypothetical protein n=1 Tax=Dokdonella sp. TaxID=2291710 RepID=UPI001AFF1D45|nr:hypothetical protein [Dokdonella sp.]MBO9663163.1 hypothetical protein [Dokdonella sp.]
MRPLLLCLARLALLTIAASAQAEPVVPASLEPWRAWVLKQQEFRACPLIAGKAGNDASDFLCAWPGVLNVAVDAGGASLAQHWRVDAEAWVPLPGDDEHWPQQVTLDGQAAPVVEREGAPMLRLAAGSHELRARIPWRERPQSLRVPQRAGLVALTIDGKAVVPVQRDGDELTLGRASTGAPEADSLDLRVYRRLGDGVPAELRTVIQIYASGQAREEIIGPVLPDGFVPLALNGEWPARLDADGRLRVRVQPGTDTLTLDARATAPLADATARVPGAPWPQQEIWSYAADPRLRISAASGAVQVDPRQAQVPSEWEALPAFALGDGAKLTIEQRSRGLAPDERNRLTLRREMWLDFDGGGWFARDHVSGEMLQGWRFDAAAPFVLERAQVAGNGRGTAGESLLVTRGAEEKLSGVEWRTPQVDLAAGLRIAPAGASLPITGWQDSFDRVDTIVHLPNGYRLLGAPGADRADGSWISRWTLLDVFVAAVLVLLAWRVLGALGGVAAAAYLVLGYQEFGAPMWSLLAALALASIARALPPGKLAVAATWLKRAALLLLVLTALPFAAGQLRYALYPQLESDRGAWIGAFDEEAPWRHRTRAPAGAGEPSQAQDEAQVAPAPAPPPPAPVTESSAPAQKYARDSNSEYLETVTVSGSKIRKMDVIERYSASTVVQTGAGEPGWQLGHRYQLAWSGPVLPTQDVRLVIAPPWLVRPLRLVLVALLAWLVLRLATPALRIPLRASAPVWIGALALGVFGASTPSRAQSFPPDHLLDELRTRLTEAPKCAPTCAAVAGAEISARGDAIEVALEVHAAERVAVPLPFDEKTLSLRSLRVDGAPQDAIARADAALWIALPRGVHRIELAFTAAADKVALAFPLKPMRAQFAGGGWEASGLVEDRLLTETLTLARSRSGDEAPVNSGAQQFAPFVRVQRALTLGLDWGVSTRVERLSPKEGGFTVEVPVLAGEHVTSAGVKVVDGRVVAAIGSDAAQAEWSSNLDKSETLSLTAPPLAGSAEVWQITVSPTWHVEFSGVPEVAALFGGDADDYHGFEFHPLPGETLTLKITRPAATQGATRAIDSVNLAYEVGQRASTSTLLLGMRASQGGDHVIALPAHAELLGVRRNGEPLNLRPQDGRLSLPLVPGVQNFEIRFRDDAPLGFRAATPAVALGLPAANIGLDIHLPGSRWLLASSGPAAGPAVLYWGELVAMLLVAFALSRLPRSPLKRWQWVLLGLGFSTFSWVALVLVVAWLFALDWRARVEPSASARRFNLAQIGLFVSTAVALLCLVASIRQGLLGSPDMHVVGNGSSAWELHWFADRGVDALPVASAFSLPLWTYQLAMLAWALWLASALVGWLRRGFAAWTRGGYWRSVPKAAAVESDAAPTAADAATATEAPSAP